MTLTSLSARWTQLALSFCLITPMITGCGDCGGEESAQRTAMVELTEVAPDAAYPNVDISIGFTITPASGSEEGISWRVALGDGTSRTGEGVTGALNHTYTESGLYTIRVEALEGGQVIGSAERPYNVYAPVDLAISGVSGRPANVFAGERLTVEASVSNTLAGEVLTPFTIGVYLSTSAQVTVEDLTTQTSLGTLTLTNIADDQPVLIGGQARTSSGELVVPAELVSGDYYLVMQLDPEGQIADTDLANNLAVSGGLIRVENSSQTLPDLVVRDVIAAPDRAYQELNRLTRGYTLANTGGLDAFDVVVKTYLSIGDNTLDDADRLLHTSEPFNVNARQTIQEPAQSFILDDVIMPGEEETLEVFVIVTAELTGDQEEVSETNNTTAAMTPIVVSSELVDGPDVAVRAFEVSPEQTFLDGSLEVTLTLANEGNVDVNAFICRLYLSEEDRINTNLDTPLYTFNVSNLTAGAEQTLTRSVIIFSFLETGSFYMYVVCDPSGSLNETFRSNNQQIYPTPITITDEADVDLNVASFTAPMQVDEGDDVMLTAEICVTGTNASGPTRANFYRSPGNSVVDFTAAAIGSVEVPNINPGQCAEVTLPIPADCAQFQANYTYGIVVDADNVLPETDETNNSRAAMPTTINGQYCACTEDLYGGMNNVRLDAAPLPVDQLTPMSLCQSGGCDFYSVSLEAGESLVVSNRFESARGRLTTRLFAGTSPAALITDANTTGRQEVGVFLAESATNYVLSVCAGTPQVRNLYELDVQVLDRDAGVDLLARTIQLPSNTTFSLGASFNVTFEAINLGLTGSGSADLEYILTSNDVIGDSDDQVIFATSTAALAPGARRTITNAVSIPATVTEGSYRLAARLIAPGDARPSNNAVLSSPINIIRQCYDVLEPNNSFQEADAKPPLDASVAFNDLVACGQADDYYKICVEDGKQLDVTIKDFDGAVYDLDLELFDAQLRGLDSSAATGVSEEQVSVNYVNGAQCYYAVVRLKSTQMMAQTTYTMELDVRDVPPALRCGGFDEPNDNFNDATDLRSISAMQILDRCPVSDTDFFYVNLNAGQTVTFRAIKEPAAQAGTLRLQLYNTARLPGVNQETAPDQPSAEIANFTAPSTGRYFLQVTVGGNARRVTYKLEADGLQGAGVDLTPSAVNLIPLGGGQVASSFTLSNLGNQSAPAPSYEIFIGAQATHDPANDVSLLASATGMALGAGATTSVANLLTLPPNTPAGTRYIHVVVSTTGDVNPSNNIASAPITIAP